MNEYNLWLFIIQFSGDYGKGPKCGTSYHTVYSTVEDTFFEKSCSKVSDRQCKTVFDTSYEGEIETQCKPEYVSKCKHVYKTGYKKYCTTVHDEECRISYATSFKTVYDKKCSTHYEKSCHDVGYGYHKVRWSASKLTAHSKWINNYIAGEKVYQPS